MDNEVKEFVYTDSSDVEHKIPKAFMIQNLKQNQRPS